MLSTILSRNGQDWPLWLKVRLTPDFRGFVRYGPFATDLHGCSWQGGYMDFQSRHKLTFAKHFLEPGNSNHRQYEALRAYFVEQKPAAEVAEQFGYTAGSLRVMAHAFRRNPNRSFFLPSERQVRPDSKRKRLRDSVVRLRKQNLSVQDISRTLSREEQSVSASTVWAILAEEGFARLPRRADEERPEQVRPSASPGWDGSECNSSLDNPRGIQTELNIRCSAETKC